MNETPAYDEAYAKLNTAQKEAVETVEGPVLVIAGPGTGKTHILTLRVANILKKTTDTNPENILVLTFTDSATRTISKRLTGLIGEEAARKVGTFTFHSFAQHVMNEYPSAFADYTERRLMGEIEQVLLWRDILETNNVQHLTTPKSPFHYLSDLKQLEDDMTRECLSLTDYASWLNERQASVEVDPALRYKRGGKTGDAGELNPTGQSKLQGILKGREAVRLNKAYRDEKEKRGLYGYTDVLRICVDILKTDEGLRADLQERYQYVLADEHQDANALQHALLDALAFDDKPNLFIVGDEKQAIFGFQGADTTHFRTFLEIYPSTKVVSLIDNYRSYQSILDLSHTLLADLPSVTGGHNELQAFRKEGGSISLLASPDPLAELTQVAYLVEQAIAEGTPPHEIAIIVAKNKTADLFALALRARGVPTLRAGTIDLESRPSIRFLLALMHAVADPNDLVHLREALLAPWWQASLARRGALLRTTRDRELSDTLAQTFPEIAQLLIELQTQSLSVPPLNLFSRLLIDTGARTHFLSDADSIREDVPLVRQLMGHIEEFSRREPNALFLEIMEQFGKAREHDIGNIKTSLTKREGQVSVITVHKAKGMEFEKVFVASLTASEWEGRGRSALIPSPFDTARDKEEAVRQFYVTLTRAKNDLILSYAVATNEGKDTKPMSLLPSHIPQLEVPVDLLPILHVVTKASALVQELTRTYLEHDGLSPSAFNEYLQSPASFFAKRVLRLREPETRAIVVGNSVHAAIATYLRTKNEDANKREDLARAELSRTMKRSLIQRGDTFDEMTRHARACLESYFESEFIHKETLAIEETFTTTKIVAGHEIILKGKVDAVFKEPGGECIIDFKTASKIDVKDHLKFERQLAFYDLVLRAHDHITTSALIIQVGEEKIHEHPIALTDGTRSEFAGLLEMVLQELVSGTWRKGEASEYDAVLELFT